MKAVHLIRYGGPTALKITERSRPTPGAREVLIRVCATSVNDWDLALSYGSPLYIRLLCGLIRPKVTIPGVDVSGRVDSTGPGVTNVSVGDTVYGDLSECGFGAFAEYVCVPESALSQKPQDTSHIEAAALPHAGLLALQSLRDVAKIRAGQTLLVNGAGGGVGTQAVQIARALGVDHIVGVDSADKAALMRRIGFDRTIDYREQDFTQIDERFDVILDVRTNRSIFKILPALTPGGTYVTVGGSTLRLVQTLVCAPLIRWTTGKNTRILALKPNQGITVLTEMVESGEICPVIDGPFRLEDAVSAVERFGSGKHVGKVVIAIHDEDT